MGRKLLLVNITESDGVTTKVARPGQNFSYEELLNQTFIEGYETQIGYSALLIPVSHQVIRGMDLRTSNVQEVVSFEEDFVEKLIIKTLNTHYHFEIIG